jgi:hypothetical protein
VAQGVGTEFKLHYHQKKKKKKHTTEAVLVGELRNIIFKDILPIMWG